MRNRLSSVALPMAALVVMSAGCSAAGDVSTEGQVRFKTATTSSSSSPSSMSADQASLGASIFVDAQGDTLEITSAQIVVRNIELRRAGVDACVSAANVTGCETLEAGPVLLDLPIGSAGASTQFTASASPDTYADVKFEIHTPSGDNSADAAFIAAHPDFSNASVRVTGTYTGSGEAFVFTTNLGADADFSLQPALVLNESGTADLTLLADLGSWFRGSASLLLDPSTAISGGVNEETVKANIRGSFEARGS